MIEEAHVHLDVPVTEACSVFYEETSHTTPEMALWCAAMQQVLRDIRKYYDHADPPKAEIANKIISWLWPGDQLSSFEEVCAILGLPPESVRRKVASSLGVTCSELKTRSSS